MRAEWGGGHGLKWSFMPKVTALALAPALTLALTLTPAPSTVTAVVRD